MGKPVMPSADAVYHVKALLPDGDGTLCGGALASMREASLCPPHLVRHFEYAYGDVDIFHPSMTSLAMNARTLVSAGCKPATKQDARTLRKWRKRDTGGWKTNSVKLVTPLEVEVNLVYKTIDKHPLRTSLEQVASFDFSNLGVSIDVATGNMYDLGDYFWPEGQDREYRMFPDREEQWTNAEIGQFTGVRQADRYARNVDRRYDLRAAKAPLVLGYRTTAEHYLDQDDDELQATALLYIGLADLIEKDEIDALLRIYEGLNRHSKVQSLNEAMKKVRP